MWDQVGVIYSALVFRAGGFGQVATARRSGCLRTNPSFRIAGSAELQWGSQHPAMIDDAYRGAFSCKPGVEESYP